jgi:hypothetical protein
MIDALIAGRLHGSPKYRTSKSGQRYATAVVRASLRDGTAIFCNVISFAETAVTALLALSEGDSVALSGELTPKVYVPQSGDPRPSLDLLAHAVISPFTVTRRRRAMSAAAISPAAVELPFDDELPGAA